MAIAAVSRSRISPTMSTSGSWRRMLRRAVPNDTPAFEWTGTWVTPGSRYSIGSSTVIIFSSDGCRRPSAAYRVVVLPLPVGPVASRSPGARAAGGGERRGEGLGCHPQRVEGPRRPAPGEQAEHHRFPIHGRCGRDAKIEIPRLQPGADAAVLRCAAFGDVQFGQQLEPGDDRGLETLRWCGDFRKHAVYPEPDAEAALRGFEVDVARAGLEGVADQEVDELDDRRLVGQVSCIGERFLGR